MVYAGIKMCQKGEKRTVSDQRAATSLYGLSLAK